MKVRSGGRGISGNFGEAGSDLGALGGGPYENCGTGALCQSAPVPKLFHTIGAQRNGCMIGSVFEPRRRFRLESPP